MKIINYFFLLVGLIGIVSIVYLFTMNFIKINDRNINYTIQYPKDK